MNKPGRRLSLLLLAAVMLFVLYAWGSASLLYRQEQQKEIRTISNVILAKMEQDAVRVHKVFNEAENTVRFFASLPPITGIGRALAGGGADPLDGTSLDTLRRRLEQIGASYTESHPEIFQIRLIGVANRGRELVRVLRDADGQVGIVAEHELQEKGERDYFTEAVNMPEGQVYFSPIDLNIERGQIEYPHRPTLRAALAVRNPRGEVFGVVVVNMLAQPLLDAVGQYALPEVQKYVTDADGRYLAHPLPGRAFSHLLAPPGDSWLGEFMPLPGLLKGQEPALADKQSVMQASDGSRWLVLTRRLREQGQADGAGLVMRAAIPLTVLDTLAWEGIRQELLLVWSEGLLILGLCVFMLLRWQGMTLNMVLQMRDDRPGRTLRLFGLKIPLTPTGRRPRWLMLLAALLPVPFWLVATLYLDQPLEHPFIGMLLPVLLAVWWGGLYSGLGATLLAVVGSWDLATAALPLHGVSGGGTLDVVGVTTLFAAGLLLSFIQENVRRRGAQLLAQQRAQREMEQRLIAQAPTGLAMFDTRMRYIATSARWKSEHHLPAERDLTGLSHYEVLPEISDRWKAMYRRALAGEAFCAHEDRFDRADGSVQWLNWECHPWHTASGEVGGLIIATEDVTRAVAQREEAEAARRELDRLKIETLERTQELERRILRTSENEQQRIGRDLHDCLGPHLAAIGYAATFLASELSQRDPAVAAKAEQLREMAVAAVSLTRDLSRGLCPVQGGTAGLSLALEELARTTSGLSHTAVTYFETGDPRVDSPEESMHLYRIAQEALNNALKHSGSSQVSIALHQSEDNLRLTIADDGKGLTASENGSRGMGLDSMKFRARELGGELRIDSILGGGTIVSCTIPHQPARSEEQTS